MTRRLWLLVLVALILPDGEAEAADRGTPSEAAQPEHMPQDCNSPAGKNEAAILAVVVRATTRFTAVSSIPIRTPYLASEWAEARWKISPPLSAPEEHLFDPPEHLCLNAVVRSGTQVIRYDLISAFEGTAGDNWPSPEAREWWQAASSGGVLQLGGPRISSDGRTAVVGSVVWRAHGASPSPTATTAQVEVVTLFRTDRGWRVIGHLALPPRRAFLDFERRPRGPLMPLTTQASAAGRARAAERVAEFELAAELWEEQASQSPADEPAEPTSMCPFHGSDPKARSRGEQALWRAIELRLALGHVGAAGADVTEYERKWGKLKPENAAAAVFLLVQYEADHDGAIRDAPPRERAATHRRRVSSDKRQLRGQHQR